MFANIVLLALTLTHGHAYQRAVKAATTVVNVVEETDPTPFYPALAASDPAAARARLARLLIVWSFYESSWTPTAIGDNGSSCGIMQIKPAHVGAKCSELLDAHRGYSAGVQVLRGLVSDCGSLKRALGAYAGGHCGDAMDIVEKRCSESDGC